MQINPQLLVQSLGVAVAILAGLVAIVGIAATIWGYRGMKAAKKDAEKAALAHVRTSIQKGIINQTIVSEVRKAVRLMNKDEGKDRDDLNEEESEK